MSRLHAVLNEANGLPLPEQRELALQLLERVEQAEVPAASTPTMSGQVSGYWYGPQEPVPAHRPVYEPTGAVLCVAERPLSDEATCLDLVKLEGSWYPLSEAGRYAYQHTTALMNGEPVRFVPVEDPWAARVYTVELEGSLPPTRVAEVYGDEAGARSRPDYPAVRLRLRKIQ